jgi:hypothetical protein
MHATTQLDYCFIYSDFEYRNAINYDGAQYYNPPMTILINGKLFILPFGSSDTKNVHIDGNHMYIIAENRSLQYISMVYIDLYNNNTSDCYFSENDLREFGDIFEMPIEEQIILLSNYLPY